MCEPSTIGLIISAAGAAVQYKNQSDASKRQSKAIDRANARDDAYQEKSLDLVSNNLQQYDPENRLEKQDEVEQNSVASFTDYLNKARDKGRGEISDATQGRVSETYTAEKAKRNVAEAGQATKVASLMAKLRAPSDLRTGEGYENANYASQVGINADNRRSMAGASQTDIQKAGELSPGMGLVGAALQGAGSAYGASAAGPAANTEFGPAYINKRGTPFIPRSLFKP